MSSPSGKRRGSTSTTTSRSSATTTASRISWSANRSMSGLTATTVEIFFKNRRVASHHRSLKTGGFTTLLEHMPKSHQRYLQWTPSRIIQWAAKNGPHTEQLVSAILESRPHPEQGFRSCLGIMRLSRRYPAQRIEAACQRALGIKALSYKSVQSILKRGLDQQPPLIPEPEPDPPPSHPNVRGTAYYQ